MTERQFVETPGVGAMRFVAAANLNASACMPSTHVDFASAWRSAIAAVDAAHPVQDLHRERTLSVG